MKLIDLRKQKLSAIKHSTKDLYTIYYYEGDKPKRLNKFMSKALLTQLITEDWNITII